MKNLISLEIRKVLLKPHMFGLAAANIIIFLLSVFTSSLLTQNGNMPAFNGLPPSPVRYCFIGTDACKGNIDCMGSGFSFCICN